MIEPGQIWISRENPRDYVNGVRVLRVWHYEGGDAVTFRFVATGRIGDISARELTRHYQLEETL